jgi:uncharacterized membrane protein YqaE (UPF0057 family)
VQTYPKLRSLLPYALAIALGALLAKVAPPWFLLPAFLVCIACVALLTLAAHTSQESTQRRGVLRYSLVFVAVLLGPAGIQAKDGFAPQAFIMSLLFLFGFVLVLAFPGAA